MAYKKSNILFMSMALICLIFFPLNGFAASSGPIKIGFLLDYTGMGGGDIPRYQHGVKVYMEEIGWEIQGRKIVFVSEDHAGDPAKGTEKAQKLVLQDKVDLVMGPIWGHVAFASAPIIAEAGIPHILPVGQSAEILKSGKGNVFMLRGTHFGENFLAGVYAYEDLGYRSAVLVHDDFIAGLELTGGAMKAFTDRGGKIVQTFKVPVGNFDFAPYLTSMKKADFVAFWVIPPEVPAFLKQYAAFNKKMPLVYTYVEAWHEIFAPAGDASLGLVGSRAWSPSINTEINKKFKKSCLEKLGRNATHYEAAGYAVGAVLDQALKATGGDTETKKLVKAIRNVKVDTPEGMISFSERGIAIGDQLIVKIVKENGRYETKVVKTYPQIERKAPWE